MKIVAAVPNSAIKDGRVIKQARSLSKRDHNVQVVGIQDTSSPSYRSIVDPNIQVFREDTQKHISKYRLIAQAALVITKWLVVLAIIFAGYSISTNIDLSNTVNSFNDLYKFILKNTGIIIFFVLAVAFSMHKKAKLKRIFNKINSHLTSYFRKIEAYFNMYAKTRAIRKAQAKRIIELEPELIYCHEALSLPACVDAKKILGVPLVYDAHEFYDDVTGINANLVCHFYKSIHKSYLKEVDFFVTVTSTILDAYYEEYPELTKNSMVLWNSVPKPSIKKYDGRLHDKSGLPHTQKILLYQGGISLKRKVDQVVLAAEELPQDWSVVIMGSGGVEFTAVKEKAHVVNKHFEQNQIVNQMTTEQLKEFKDLMVRYFEESFKTNDFPKENLPPIPPSDTSEMTEYHSAFMRNYSNKRFKIALNTFAKERQKHLSKSLQNKVTKNFESTVHKIMTDTNLIIDFQTEVQNKEWHLAKRLALSEMSRRYPEALKVVPRVVFIPSVPQSELSDWTRGATIGTIPYPITSLNHWGCGPNKLWEYPSSGVPIIATPSSEIRKAIIDHGIGWTIEADPTSESIAGVIRKISDEDLAKAKQNCTDFIQVSNWEIHTRDWFKIIEGLNPK